MDYNKADKMTPWAKIINSRQTQITVDVISQHMKLLQDETFYHTSAIMGQ
jgi:hypothetical protein